MEQATLTTCRPIIILGAHRSGTSLVSDLIVQWGAYPGDLSLHPEANPHNPRGFFEYRPMIEMLSELSDTTSAWVMSREFRNQMRDLSFNPLFQEKAHRLIAGMEVQGTPWVWKEPNLAPFLPFWEPFLKDPLYVITVRNPNDSAKSFEKMFLSRELRQTARLTAYFCLLWQCTLLAALDHTHNRPKVLFLWYDALLQFPEEQCRRLCEFLDRHVGLTEGQEERLRLMIETIDPGLWRNKSSASFFEVPEASEAQKELYRYLLRRAEGHAEPFEESRYPLPACTQEYLRTFKDFKDLLENQAVLDRQKR